MLPDADRHGWHMRPAVPADAPVLSALEQECFPLDAFSKRQIRYYFRCSIPQGHLQIWLACSSAGNVGGAYYLCTPSLARRRMARLFSVAVRPALHRQGLGEKLVADAEARAQRLGYRGISAETRVENVASRTLFARRGWQITAPLPDYYSPGSDGLRWRLDFAVPPAAHPDRPQQYGQS